MLRLNKQTTFFKEKYGKLIVLITFLIFIMSIWCVSCNFRKNDSAYPVNEQFAEILARKKLTAPQLTPGQPYESKSLPEDEILDFYAVQLDAGNYMRIAVKEISKPYISGAIKVHLIDPQNNLVIESDDSSEAKYIGWLAETGGQFTVVVRRYNKGKGQHRIELVVRKPADEQDYIRATAFRAATIAFRDWGSFPFSNERMKAALPKYEEAAALFHSVGDLKDEAFTLRNIGRNYEFVDDYKRAADYYQRALEIFRTAQDREGEFDTMSRLCPFYVKEIPDTRRAIECTQKTIEMAEEDNDFSYEVYAFRRLGDIYESHHTLEGTAQKLEAYNSALVAQHKISEQLAVSDASLVPASGKDEARLLSDIGTIQNQLGQTANALESYRQALKLAREFDDELEEDQIIKMIAEIKTAKTK